MGRRHQRRWMGYLLGCQLLLALPLLPQIGLTATSAAEYRQLGLLYRSQARYGEAIAVLQSAAQLDPKNLSGRVLLGWTQHLNGQQDDAVATLVQTLQQDPSYVPALNAVGIVYLVQGDLWNALWTHSWAALLSPDNEVAHYNLSLTYGRLQLYGWAVLNAKQAAILEPNNPHPLVAMAIAQWQAGDRAAARQTYGQTLTLDPRYGDRAFLTHLQAAAFSPDQIQTTAEVLAATVP